MADLDNSTFRPTASLETLRLRAKLMQQLRAFFINHGFLEVETPLLSADTVIDRHLDPIEVTLSADPRVPTVGRRMFLQTSPEFHMKRLLATGQFDAIFQVGKAFRAAERGSQHNPEFTMLEWYRVGDDYQAGVQLLSDLAEVIFQRGPAERITQTEAFTRAGQPDPASLESHARDLAFVEQVQPELGLAAPTIMYDYTADEAALAKVRPGDPPVAERFELFVDGIELANGYHELLDADELERRTEAIRHQRATDGKPPLPDHETQLAKAMRHGLPPCSGVALGFDRLVMVVSGAKVIDDVIAFPIERA